MSAGCGKASRVSRTAREERGRRRPPAAGGDPATQPRETTGRGLSEVGEPRVGDPERDASVPPAATQRGRKTGTGQLLVSASPRAQSQRGICELTGHL